MPARIESLAEPVPGYRLLDRLGSGGFGEVWRAEAPGGIFKAVKIIHGDMRDRSTDGHRFAEQELKAMKRVQQVRHPYLLAIDRYDIVDGRLMIVMELADCNLWDRFRACRKGGLPGIPREELLRYMSETAEVLDLFDERFQLQHLDIKPQNLFLLHDHVKVADFGQVKDLQNHMAQVTGGITPVYAAPETFDGFVSRYCDQYSLACVYQELLTGVRPFDGTSMQQLLMQHLQLAPNLTPAPAADRPALARALAKQPGDRFPNVRSMVAALRDGTLAPAAKSPLLLGDSPSGRIEVSLPVELGLSGTGLPASYAPAAFARDLSPTPAALVETSAPPDRVAPPEVRGTGCLRPTVVVGIGHTGRLVLQRLRKQVGDRFGPADRTPLLRTVYIDTDPEALAAASSPHQPPGVAPLAAEDVVPAKLGRAAYYTRPRLNGRTLLDGWFDPQWLYKLPRIPATLGLRAFGRLAFVDHYRAVAHKLQLELEAALDPDALEATRAATGLDASTNRPRVYVVAGLGGGTGSGMLLDLAYAVRLRLRSLGYSDPDVVGVLLAPPDAPGAACPQAQANAYAALTEVHHFGRPATQFTAVYDERALAACDAGPPFRRVFVTPGLDYPSPPMPGSGGTPMASPRSTRTPAATGFPAGRGSGAIRMTPPRLSGGQRYAARPAGDLGPPAAVAAAADFLRVSLFTPAGPMLDEVRGPAGDPDHGSFVRTFGLARFGWPRGEVVGRTARILATVVVNHWVNPDPATVRMTVPAWADEHWVRCGLDLDALGGHLLRDAESQCGVHTAQVIADGAAQLAPRGWLGRAPDAAHAVAVIDRWAALLGRPKQPLGPDPKLPAALVPAVERRVAVALADLTELFAQLVETPQFRLAGAEEAVRQVLGRLDRDRAKTLKAAAVAEAAAETAFGRLRVTSAGRPSGGVFADAVKVYPREQLRGLKHRAAAGVYRGVKDALVATLAELTACRQRLEAGVPLLARDAERPAEVALPDELLPVGCPDPEQAAQVFLKSLTDDDLADLEVRVQEGLEQEFGGLYQACLNATDAHLNVFRVLRERTREYLEARLGEVDFSAMLFARLGGPASAVGGLANAHDAALPRLVGSGPWAAKEISLYVGPAGKGGDPAREAAAEALPEGTIDAPSPDEVIVYRETAEIPLGALPQFGPTWAAAYRTATEQSQVPAHARVDVTNWADVDGA
jgi:serine/threonine protein kinase